MTTRQLKLCPTWSCWVRGAQVPEQDGSQALCFQLRFQWVTRRWLAFKWWFLSFCFLAFFSFVTYFFKGAGYDCHNGRWIPSLLCFCLLSEKTAAAVLYSLEDYWVGLLSAPRKDICETTSFTAEGKMFAWEMNSFFQLLSASSVVISPGP